MNSLSAFPLAVALLLLVPGPVMALVVGNTMRAGVACGMRTVAGIGAGEAAALGLLLVGASYGETRLSSFMPWLALAASVYLIWLGLVSLFAFRSVETTPGIGRAERPFFDGVAVAASSPAGLLLYSALFMPFIDPGKPVTPQLAVLSGLYIAASLVFDALCVLVAGRFGAAVGSDRTGACSILASAVYLLAGFVAARTFIASI